MAMSAASTAIPKWVSYSMKTSVGPGHWKSVGLYAACASVSTMTLEGHECRSFPGDEFCKAGGGYERTFCSMWRDIRLMAWLVLSGHATSIGTLLAILAGGRMKRETGWKFLGCLLPVIAIVELSILGIVAYLYDHDDQFMVPGQYLDTSWYLGATSATITVLVALGLCISALVLPPEIGYRALKGTA